jgi:alkanesulfonate monooxygenase SsuD/methylene tetrahydromethanopterin reductase-like flavin-dependent oxidoreductase (luciferase family)
MARQRFHFGIGTPQQQVTYEQLRSLWVAADHEPLIEDVWLFDHLIALGDDPKIAIPEGWSLLAALATQTRRLRIGIGSANKLRDKFGAPCSRQLW